MHAISEVHRPSTGHSQPHHGTGLHNFFAHHGIWAPGVRLFRRLGFRTKAWLMTLVLVAPLAGLIVWQAWNGYHEDMASHEHAVRQQVETAYGVLTWAHAQESAGTMDRATAQRAAMATLRDMRYGKDLSDRKDPNGLPIFQLFARTGRDGGEGFVQYQWPHKAGETPADKISFVKGFAPWGWVLGSGPYVDHVLAAAQQRWKVLGQIALGAREQDAGVSQVSQAIGELDHMTQQNAALVEQTAAASTLMREQARTLAQDVARFRLPADAARA